MYKYCMCALSNIYYQIFNQHKLVYSIDFCGTILLYTCWDSDPKIVIYSQYF